jgi:hypothetical protein
VGVAQHTCEKVRALWYEAARIAAPVFGVAESISDDGNGKLEADLCPIIPHRADSGAEK